MAKMKYAAILALSGVAGTVTVVGALATGCSSDDSGNPVSPADAASDRSVVDAPTDQGKGGDTTTGNDASDAGTTGDASDSGTTGDASDSGTTGDASDGGTTGDASDGGGSDASDSGHLTDGGSDASDAGDGAVPEAGCTTIHALSDGGTAVLLTGFDNAASIAGWSPNVDNALDGGPSLDGSAVAYSATVGRTCPGAVALTVPFTTYGFQQVEVQYDYNVNPESYALWTNATTLHYFVKVAFEGADGGVLTAEAGAPEYNGLQDDNNFAQWNNYTAANYNNPTGNTDFFAGTTFSAGEWQEVTLSLNDPTQATVDGGAVTPMGASCLLGNACKFASQLEVPPVAPDAGPAAPTTTVLYIDDVWIE
jgi:hypothetical protein